MCGRYVLASKAQTIEKELLADFSSAFTPFFNAHPGGSYPVISCHEPQVIREAQWGLTPYWSRWGNTHYNYNAFITDLVRHPVYRRPVRKNRCLVPANCYYCWIRVNGVKEPYVVYIKDQRLFTMAGVFDVWQDRSTNKKILSFAIVTGYSNKRIAKYCPTMPVIIPPSRRSKYLKNDIPLQEVMRMLRPFESDQFNLYPVSKNVNNPLFNTKELLQPVGQLLYPEYYYGSKDYFSQRV